MIKTSAHRLIDFWRRSDTEVKVVIIFLLLFATFIFISYQEINSHLRVKRDGSIKDQCNTRSTSISAKISNSLTCSQIKLLSNRLGFWERQLELARASIAYYEKIPKYQEFWRDTYHPSSQSTKFKELKYSSIDDAYEQEMNSIASQRQRLSAIYEKERHNALQDLVPGSGKWTEEKSNIDRRFANIGKSLEESEKRIINRYQYALDQKEQAKEIESIIEKRIIFMRQNKI
jgi:hypothetical protein